MTRLAAGIIFIAATVLLTSCDGRSRRASAKLRSENAALHREVEALQDRQVELEASLTALATEQGGNRGAAAQTPQVAGLTISPLSGFEPGEGPDALRLEIHVAAQDGRQRPIQLVGPLEAQVLRPVPGRSPVVLATTKLDPTAVRDAWRGGLLGATYRVDVMLDTASIEPDTPVLVHVFHTDARTGRSLEATSSVAHRPSTRTSP
ncbi:MAG: hypothetical protein MK077_06780 [Phycisphaerales bacterium]|nr:hypothetical protein [Phycisphaerales bacterium]